MQSIMFSLEFFETLKQSAGSWQFITMLAALFGYWQLVNAAVLSAKRRGSSKQKPRKRKPPPTQPASAG
jgi:hypothetical protein